MPDATYEERFDPITRRVRRFWRRVRRRWAAVRGASPRILVEIRWRLGDEVMAIPVYEALKNRYRSSHLAVWCNYPDLLRDNPFVDAVNPEEVHPHRYILLRGTPRDVCRIDHYAALAGVPCPDYPPRLHYTDWSCPLLETLPGDGSRLVAVCTGASWPTKRWPIERWRTLCRGLLDAGCHVVQLGHEDEEIGFGTSLVNRTSVRDAACVLRASRALVCCDSGLMHLALAVNTPAIALFGPTDPSILIRDNPDLEAITAPRDCRGCWNRPGAMREKGVCPLGDETCLEGVTPEHVLSRVMNRIELEH